MKLASKCPCFVGLAVVAENLNFFFKGSMLSMKVFYGNWEPKFSKFTVQLVADLCPI